MAKTWKDVDDIIQLTEDGVLISVAELELVFASDDKARQKTIISALREKHGKFEAEIYPLSGVRLDPEIQRTRLKRLFVKGVQTLINDIYTQAKRAEKKKAKGSSKSTVTIEEFAVLKKDEEITSAVIGADGEIIKTTDIKVSKDSKSKTKFTNKEVKKDIRDQIVFSNLKPIEELTAYVPSIDENYEFPSFTVEFAKFLDNDLNIWLHGGTGSGKSSLVEQVCATANIPLLYCSFHEDIKPDQLFGGFRLVDGNTVWQDGPVTKAYRDGLVLLLDEIDGLPPEIAFSLYAITDHKPLILTENNNEVIQPHPNFRVVATGNTHGRGDESGMYSGTNILNRAFLNRFRIWYKVEYPTKRVYKNLIKREGVDNRVAEIIATFAHEINSAFNHGTLTETFSLRDAREVAKAANILNGDIERALKLTLMNRLSTIEQAQVNEMYRRIC